MEDFETIKKRLWWWKRREEGSPVRRLLSYQLQKRDGEVLVEAVRFWTCFEGRAIMIF